MHRDGYFRFYIFGGFSSIGNSIHSICLAQWKQGYIAGKVFHFRYPFCVARLVDGYAAETEVNVCRSLEPVKKEEVLYVEADGSMLLTREEGWKEVKVGRMFTSGSCIDPNGKISWIRHSQYVAHLGNNKDFTKQMDTLIESYGRLGKRLVFIADGGTWIKTG